MRSSPRSTLASSLPVLCLPPILPRRHRFPRSRRPLSSLFTSCFLSNSLIVIHSRFPSHRRPCNSYSQFRHSPSASRSRSSALFPFLRSQSSPSPTSRSALPYRFTSEPPLSGSGRSDNVSRHSLRGHRSCAPASPGPLLTCLRLARVPYRFHQRQLLHCLLLRFPSPWERNQDSLEPSRLPVRPRSESVVEYKSD